MLLKAALKYLHIINSMPRLTWLSNSEPEPSRGTSTRQPQQLQCGTHSTFGTQLNTNRIFDHSPITMPRSRRCLRITERRSAGDPAAGARWGWTPRAACRCRPPTTTPAVSPAATPPPPTGRQRKRSLSLFMDCREWSIHHFY